MYIMSGNTDFDRTFSKLNGLFVTSQDKFRGLKTAPEDSLTFFLAVCICIVYHSYGGKRMIFT